MPKVKSKFRIAVELPKDLYDFVAMRAAKEFTNKSTIIRKSVSAYAAQPEEK